MTKEEAVKRVLDIARAEIGTGETGNNLTKYASAYDWDTRLYGFDMNGQPWCDYFVDWCFMKAFGFEIGSAMTFQFAGCSGAACAASAGYYQQHGAWRADPDLGDQIFSIPEEESIIPESLSLLTADTLPALKATVPIR